MQPKLWAIDWEDSEGTHMFDWVASFDEELNKEKAAEYIAKVYAEEWSKPEMTKADVFNLYCYEMKAVKTIENKLRWNIRLTPETLDDRKLNDLLLAMYGEVMNSNTKAADNYANQITILLDANSKAINKIHANE